MTWSEAAPVGGGVRSVRRVAHHVDELATLKGMSASINLAVIPGDGIGPEVIAEAVKVLGKVCAADGIALQRTEYKLGAEHWLRTGETLPDATLNELRKHDAILFGAVGAAPGDTRIPSGLIEREMLLKLRFSLDHYVNLRPSRLYPGVDSPLANPGTIDFVVVREGTEGPYAGMPSAPRKSPGRSAARRRPDPWRWDRTAPRGHSSSPPCHRLRRCSRRRRCGP